MKRWMSVWLAVGVLGVVGCKKEEEKPPIVEEPPVVKYPYCNVTGTGQASVDPEERVLVDEGPRALSAGPAREKVIVRLRDDAGPGARSRVEGKGEVRRRGGKGGKRVSMHVTAEERAALAADPDVLWVEPNHPVYALKLPQDALRSMLAAALPSADPAEYTSGLKVVQAPAVWDANNDGVFDTGAPTGEGIKVCVLDSGLDTGHPEFQGGVIVAKRNFVDTFLPEAVDDVSRDADGGVTGVGTGHGTHVAGTIAAQPGVGGVFDPGSMSAKGVVGVAPGASLLIARVLSGDGKGSSDGIADAIDWCVEQGANILSMSLGSPSSSSAQLEAINAASQAGRLIVAATGNDGVAKCMGYPAAYTAVLAVGATLPSGSQVWEFSQTGPNVSVVAPGVDVLSTVLRGGGRFSYAESGGVVKSNALSGSGDGNVTGTLVNCGFGETASSCGASPGTGFVAYVDRGKPASFPEDAGVFFYVKARNARAQGARAVIVGNNEGGDTGNDPGNFTLVESLPDGGVVDAGVYPPVTSVGLADATRLKAQRIGQPATVSIGVMDYDSFQGTSMATPHVSGVAALLWSAKPSLTAAQVRELLETTALDLTGSAAAGPTATQPWPGRDNYSGFGLVQAKTALDKLYEKYGR